MPSDLTWVPYNDRPKASVDLLNGGGPEAEVNILLHNSNQEVEDFC